MVQKETPVLQNFAAYCRLTGAQQKEKCFLFRASDTSSLTARTFSLVARVVLTSSWEYLKCTCLPSSQHTRCEHLVVGSVPLPDMKDQSISSDTFSQKRKVEGLRGALSQPQASASDIPRCHRVKWGATRRTNSCSVRNFSLEQKRLSSASYQACFSVFCIASTILLHPRPADGTQTHRIHSCPNVLVGSHGHHKHTYHRGPIRYQRKHVHATWTNFGLQYLKRY